MKPAPFDYHAPTGVPEVMAILDQAGGEARLLAGGQSLVPLLNMRLARPRVLVDLNRVVELSGVEELESGTVRIGAMTRQRALETDPLLRAQLPVLAEAARHIAHLAIRTRGTVGGSLAHADPAAELPAVALLLGAALIAVSSSGKRSIPAAEFFAAPFTTSLAEGEILEAVEVARPSEGTGFSFVEVARVHGAFALVGAGAAVAVSESGVVHSARLAFCGLAGTPQLFPHTADVVVGRVLDEALLDDVEAAVSGWADPIGDIHASPEYRRQVAGTLARRAIEGAGQRAGRSR